MFKLTFFKKFGRHQHRLQWANIYSVLGLVVVACSPKMITPSDPTCTPGMSTRKACAARFTTTCMPAQTTRSKIKNVVVIIQENHSFDSYFGKYCQAPSGSNPSCTTGPNCCEAGPLSVSGLSPVKLTDAQNYGFDPNHTQACQIAEINGGRMDRFASGSFCSHPNNYAYGDRTTLNTYWNYAASGALADRYFQPVAGASSSNDMYFARAAFVFVDNSKVPNTIGSHCSGADARVTLYDPTLGDLLASCKVPWAFYAEGYRDVLRALPPCPSYPEHYDPGDNPFQYYQPFQDNETYQKDYAQLKEDLLNNTLPAVSFVKALGVKTEHPGLSTITDGQKFVEEAVNSILNSDYRNKALILVVPDESGGYYDHIPPPPTSTVDRQPYGPRIPLLALGYFAKKNSISHVVMEHSSIVRFVEWNFIGGNPGQLNTRDATVNGIGSLLDSEKAGIEIP